MCVLLTHLLEIESLTLFVEIVSNCCSFSNLGNTCYMNAILQALFALVPFSTDLLNVADRLEADNSMSTTNHRRSVGLTLAQVLPSLARAVA